MSHRIALAVLAALALGACTDAATAPTTPDVAPSARQDGGPGNGAVYSQTNAAAGNSVVLFHRAPDGTLERGASYATGGLGTGGGLGNQGALALSHDNKLLLAVNAGSDDISVFDVRARGLSLLGTVPSGGDQPISLTVHGRLVYVLNAGSETITGFIVGRHGALEPLPGSTRPIGGPGPAQVQFTPDGRQLVVTIKGTSVISTFLVGRTGLASGPNVQPSVGMTPFGFDFDRRGHLIVSEAFGGATDASALSSYDVGAGGTLAVISPSVGTTETAACWVVVTKNGRHVYTTNTGSASVTGYAIARDGELKLLDADGRTATTGAAPTDAAISHDGRFLYVLNSGDGTIRGYRIQSDGALTPINTVPGLPSVGATGLVAW